MVTIGDLILSHWIVNTKSDSFFKRKLLVFKWRT